MSKLFSSLQLRDITLKNRIAVSPMCQYSAIDGFANNWHLVHYGSRVVGGAALIIQEATAVVPEGRISPGDLGIYENAHIVKLKEITTFIKQHGAVAGIQLAHAGRKASCSQAWFGGKQLTEKEGGWQTVAPSTLAFNDDDRLPEELDSEGIKKVISAFKTATERALLAGFQVIEIHAAHGYLLHQFLSPLSNKRTDNYGGSFENRIRLLVEVVRAANEILGNKNPLFVRISATDYIDGGWNADEAVKLAAVLLREGVDLIDTSSGGLVPYAKMPFGPGYQVVFAERIKKGAGIRTGAVGLITDAAQAEEILEKSQADLVLFGREMLRNPYFAMQAASELDEQLEWPLQYLRSKPVPKS